tara:strand:- start:181 stop:990 length:810 start_codon:yes stop_codon:yes gene_type:complete
MNKNKIFISGITGDIGKELRKKFKEKDIVKYKRLKTENKIKIKKQLENIFKKNKIETIFHCSTIFKGSKKKIFDCNYVYSKIIYKLAIKYKVRYFFNFDTILPMKVNIYSESKNKFYNYIKLKKKIRTFNLKIGHVYGSNNNKEKLIPTLINKIKKNSKINLTKGNQKRFFINIKKLISSINKIYIRRYKFKNIFNEFYFISEKQISIKTLVKMIINIINKDFDKVAYGALEYRKNEIMKFNKAKLKGTKVIIKSNLLRDLNEICYRKN